MTPPAPPWYWPRWTPRARDVAKPLVGRLAHGLWGVVIVALGQEILHPGTAFLISMGVGLAWEFVSALVMRFYWLRWKYDPEAADAWLPSVGDLIPWIFGACVGVAYWWWLFPREGLA